MDELEDGKSSAVDGDDRDAVMMLRKAMPSRPQVVVPLRTTADTSFKPSEAGHSPMSLGVSFFADHEPEAESKSFTDLLTGPPQSPCVKGGLMKSSKSRMTSSPGGSFAERLAARGATISNLKQESTDEYKPSTVRMKLTPPSQIPIPPSNCFTVPPDLSPITLLDSPVLFSSSQAEPSPTTGRTYRAPSIFSGAGVLATTSSESSKESGSEREQEGSSAFVFKPLPKQGAVNSLSSFGNLENFGLAHQCIMPNHEQQDSSGIYRSSPPAFLASSSPSLPPKMLSLTVGKQHASGPASEEADVSPKEPVPTLVEQRPSEDGYNWRKYGQKQVKGSEYPRSYYKCTYANCPVKKKVERSLDGQVTEIVYKGEHTHAKPQSNRRTAVGSTLVISDGIGRDSSYFTRRVGEKADDSSGLYKVNGFRGSAGWMDFQTGSKGQGFLRADGTFERASSGIIDGCAPTGYSAELAGISEPSASSYSDDDEQGSKISIEDGDEPESKRRRRENILTEITGVQRTIREPRIVVQTTSDIDILDDGYRWRKYGQKVVKGNPHPRSYYKCTHAGCPVRKHVERASNDPKSVITTYEGKHNHDVPVAKSGGHDSGGTSGAPSLLTQTASFSTSHETLNSATTSIRDEGFQFTHKTAVCGRLLEDDSKNVELGLSDVDLRGRVGRGMLSTDISSIIGQKEELAFPPAGFVGLADSIKPGNDSSRVEAFDSVFNSSNVPDLVFLPKQECEDDSFQPFVNASSSIFHHNVAPKLVLRP
ncbi:hypothetical protein O6H91_05G100100 [Diphasiastrum complanatum]|uniref:Uncharacterized protein n=1 Tax=Diphasiastrum complanatum TaxID=34168 RepID=A0ACC2DRI6_DIPCM|nr:hypothetical protein O6H91_Y459700 [Diphasiastrum complanatum]KAJ7556809.1 hypothetical protein O6H91_05G100100 [Diphasiastrum complanatum]